MKERLWYIDWMKTIGMLFIMIGHFAPYSIAVFAFSFSVQLFFFVSGFLFKKSENYGIFITKNTQSLLVPYLLWGGLLILFLFVRTQGVSDFGKSIVGLSLGLNNYEGIRGCGELWFVVTLLGLKCIAQFLNPGKTQLIFIVLLFSALAIVCRAVIFESRWEYSGFGLMNVFVASPFFFGGYALSFAKEKVNHISEMIDWRWLPILLLLIAILITAASKNGLVLMVYGQYGNNYLLFVLLGYLGIVCSWISSVLLYRLPLNSISCFISIGTIVILATHVGILNRIKPIIMELVSNDTLLYGITSCLIPVVLLVLYAPVIIGLRRYAPILLGNR